ncbi:ACT domain-containing protein, partial [Achromobacter xylosoxidans]
SARSAPILIQGNEGQAVQLAPCCGPLPGDPIIAGMRMGHGLVVHTADCPVAMRQRLREPERWINVAWDAHTAKHLATRLDIVTRNERGVLGRLAAEVTAADANIMHVTMHDDAVSTVSLHLTIQVDSRKHLAQVIRAIRHVPQVQKIVRVKG